MTSYRVALAAASILFFFAGCGPKEAAKIEPTPSAAPALKPLFSVKILSLNLNQCKRMSSVDALRTLAGFIQQQDVDIIALEDISLPVTASRPNYVRELARLIDFQSVAGTTRLPQMGEHGNAILSRLPIAKSDNVMLPHLKKNNDHGILYAAVDLGAMKIILLSTHLDEAIGDRDEQRIADSFSRLQIEFKDYKMFICGTFYDETGSPLLKTLLARYTNAADVASFPSDQPKRHCSYILFPAGSGFVIDTTGTFDTGISNHRAILTRLTYMAPAIGK